MRAGELLVYMVYVPGTQYPSCLVYDAWLNILILKYLNLGCLLRKANKTEVLMFTRRRQWHPIQVLLPGKSHGWRNLVGYTPWGRKESDTTERLHFLSF